MKSNDSCQIAANLQKRPKVGNHLAVVCIFFVLASCKTVTVNVPMDNVKLSDGYYNSSTLSLGDMWIWDTKTGSISLIYTFTNKELSAPTESDPYDQKRSAISSDTNFETSGNVDALKALSKAAGSATDSTQGQLGAKVGLLEICVRLQNHQRERYLNFGQAHGKL
jgi:hypothetical protein